MFLLNYFVIIETCFHLVLCIRFENSAEVTSDAIISRRQSASFFPQNDAESSYQNNNYGNYDKYINQNYNDDSTNNDIFKIPNAPREQYSQFDNNDIQYDGFNQGEYYVGNNPVDNNNNIVLGSRPPPSFVYDQQNSISPSSLSSTSQQYNRPYHQTNPYFTNENYAQYYNYQNGPSFDSQSRPPPSSPPAPTRYKKRKRPYQQPLQQRPQRPAYYQPTSSDTYPYDPSTYSPQNYANDYNQYQLNDGNPITNFFQNIGQGAANLFNGGGLNGFGGNGVDSNPNIYNNNGGQYRPQPPFGQYPSGFGPQQQQQQPGGPFGQLGKAVDEITRNDDYQCIPKVLCQMVGSQRRQNIQSTILSSPIFSALIAAVPSTTSGLVYGRAALLGYTSGEHSCDGAYPKCPRNEDDLLYYLNNHRGGFFRFFNGGAAFGDDVNYHYNPNPLQQNQHQQQPLQQQSALGQLGALQGLADAINQGGGINLSNLGSNAGLLGNLASLIGAGGAGGAQNSIQTPVAATSLLGGGNAGSSIGDFVGNLLTGFVGNRFSSRKITKRSIPEKNTIINNNSSLSPLISLNANLSSIVNSTDTTTESNTNLLIKLDAENHFEKQSISKKRNLDKDNFRINIDDINQNDTVVKIQCKHCSTFTDDSKNISNNNNTDKKEIINIDDDDDDGDDPNNIDNEINEIEARIVNSKHPILSDDYILDTSNYITFPKDEDNVIRNGRYVNFYNTDDVNNDDDRYDLTKLSIVKFNNDNVDDIVDDKYQQLPIIIKFPDDSTNRISKTFNTEQQPPTRTKMIFPDRTGTGNLRFDNNYFNLNSNRYGKILTGIKTEQNSNSNNYNYNNNYNNRDDDKFYFNTQPINYNRPSDNYDNNNNNYNNNNNKFSSQNYLKPIAVYPPNTNTNNINNDRFQNYQSNSYTQSTNAANKYPAIYSSSYSSSNYNNNNYNNNINNNKYNYNSKNEDTSQNVYVTNSKGVIEYYINAADMLQISAAVQQQM